MLRYAGEANVISSKPASANMPNATSADGNGARPRSHSAKQLLTVSREKTVCIDLAVKRLGCDAQLGAQLADLGAGLAHGGLRQP